MKRKLLSILLTLCLAFSLLPTAALAGEAGTGDGTSTNPYTLDELGNMTRADYIAAQERLGDTMYVTVGDYSYDKDGVLGNGVRDDTTGQIPDHSKLNAYGENGYLGEKNDGANGKNIVFVGSSITSGVTGYASIDNIGTSLLLAVPAYTNVTFKGITFNNVMSFNYQLYTSPWSQLGELKFENCEFNGIIVGAIAAQTLTFNGCEFKNFTNTASANNSNPTWIRPAYGNWTKGDNEGQGSDFRSLTKINFTGNTVTSTRPVKFERIAQWEMDTKVTATGNKFTISVQEGDTSTKNVGMYFGANAKFDLVADNNEKLGDTAALYTAVYTAPNGTSYAGLPAGSAVKDSSGNDTTLDDSYEWKTTTKLTLATTEEVAELTTTNGKGGVAVVKYATLAEAIANAKDGDTVKLLQSCSGDGIKIETGTFAIKGLTVDFGGNTYTVGGVLVGSATTGTNAFQLLQGGKVAFQNGSIVGVTEGTKPAEDTPDWHGAPAIMIQNYCDLTLENMTVIGGDQTVYTMSNNHGEVVIENSTITAGKAQGYTSPAVAFDVCGFDSYDGVSVTVKGSSTINGNIEISRSSNNANDVNLTLESGTVNGELKIDKSIKPGDATTTITKSSNVTLVAPSGYLWDENGKLAKAVAQIGDIGYATLSAAIAAAQPGDTVKLLGDVTETDAVNAGIGYDLTGKTLDLNGFTYSHNNFAHVFKGTGGTIKNGKMVCLNNGSYALFIGDSPKTESFTVDSVELTGGINIYNATGVVLKNLTVNGADYYAVWLDNGAAATIESGTYNAGSVAVFNGQTGSPLTVTGGTIYTNGKPLMGTSGGTLSVSGGTFDAAVAPEYCADGFVPKTNGDGTYGVARPSSSSSSGYSVSTPSKTENGAVTVSPRYADKGDTVTVTVKPDSGYVLGSLTVTDSKGNELTLTDKGNGKYTFTMPSGRVEVKASFTKEVETSPFADVATDAYYYEAVKWAVSKGITDGVGNNLFAPGQPCTRAQIVTFLWRAAGSPEPKGTAAGMTDVVSGSYYEKAVAWAIENGVTTGTTATTFSPDATCTRAQAVTFLARALNAKASGAAEFSDVPTDSYFANAVAWAASNGVTEGVGNGLFAPDNDCTRGQIVTFLYRAYNK